MAFIAADMGYRSYAISRGKDATALFRLGMAIEFNVTSHKRKIKTICSADSPNV